MNSALSQMNSHLSRANWFKSTYSESGSTCVEVAWLEAGRAGVRDSKDPSGPALIFAPNEWTAFAIDLHSGGYTGRSDIRAVDARLEGEMNREQQ